MALLAVVVSVSLPNLKGFFRGRSIDSEARRFLSLTRYAQSRAVSEGMPMVLWIDERGKAYGLRTQPGYVADDTNAIRYALDDSLDIEARMPLRTPIRWQPILPGLANATMIRFTPDGFIGDASPDRIVLRQGNENEIWIVGQSNRLSYAIQSGNEAFARR